MSHRNDSKIRTPGKFTFPLISITMRFDDEDAPNHPLIPHVCGKHGIKGNAQTLSAPACKSRSKTTIIMATGCGHDLISRNRAKKLGVQIEENDNPMSFYTANGVNST